MKKRWLCLAVLALCYLLSEGCNNDSHVIESISIDFPHGETRLVVWKNGEAALFYGALPQHNVVKTGIFDVENLYKQLQLRLHRNGPREEWPNPTSTSGMVQIKFKDKGNKDYLIFDEKAFAEELFSKARLNFVGK